MSNSGKFDCYYATTGLKADCDTRISIFTYFKSTMEDKIMLTVTPFILFDGNCAEAMAFYQGCFGGELVITTLGDTPMKEQVPKEMYHKVTHAVLKSEGIEFSATDWMHPTRKFKQGNSVAMYLNGGTYHELKKVFDKLSDGADAALLDELREMPFGTYGHLADRYGIHWFFTGKK